MSTPCWKAATCWRTCTSAACRLPAPAMLANVVAKIVAYENEPHLDNDIEWFTRAGLARGSQRLGLLLHLGQPVGQAPSVEFELHAGRHHLERQFHHPDDEHGQRGRNLLHLPRLLGMSGLNTGYIDAMNNGEKLPFALVLTCDTGSFRSDTACRSEAFLRGTQRWWRRLDRHRHHRHPHPLQQLHVPGVARGRAQERRPPRGARL